MSGFQKCSAESQVQRERERGKRGDGRRKEEKEGRRGVTTYPPGCGASDAEENCLETVSRTTTSKPGNSRRAGR